jgi:hypothetical protein
VGGPTRAGGGAGEFGCGLGWHQAAMHPPRWRADQPGQDGYESGSICHPAKPALPERLTHPHPHTFTCTAIHAIAHMCTRMARFCRQRDSPRTCPVSLLRAHTTTTSAHVPLPIQRFCPSSCQPPGTLVAVQVRADASLPLDGSVSAQQPTCRQPLNLFGVVWGERRASRQYLSCCSAGECARVRQGTNQG